MADEDLELLYEDDDQGDQDQEDGKQQENGEYLNHSPYMYLNRTCMPEAYSDWPLLQVPLRPRNCNRIL